MRTLRYAWTMLLAAACVSVSAGGPSLYDEANFRALTSDRRAQKPGDLLTVLVFETASASASTDTQTGKSGGPGFALESTNVTRNRAAKLTLTEDFNGRGRIQRSGKLAAQLTVVVQSVEPNGDLHVSGEQLLRVNDERQEIVLSGRVRPIDIGENNTVVSSRLADAQISYVGDGALSEKSRPGIISRVLTWMGLL